LRDNGKTVDVDLLRRGIGKSLKYASSINAQKAIIVGKEELGKNSVAIKDMKTGKQEIIKVKGILKCM
ncbi:MAG: His/Gly/Thr/Pro-type tRNA ligase C-terminal domain-containing protein, partial [Candidatus Thermoplasmatota archaeon]|nr:His/Gly/Thr/Pro-type tRNA ligase C-terminal domain-containing protein [Candidatus Thermoplasmatota archaeon]